MPTIKSKYFEYLKLEKSKDFPESHCLCIVNDPCWSDGIFINSESKTKKKAVEFIDVLIKDLKDLKKKVSYET